MITAPLLTHAVKVDLPKAASAPNESKRANVQLAIDSANQVFWNGEPVARETLAQKLAEAAGAEPQPELHIRAERSTPYEQVAQLMSAAARNGLNRIAFVTDPSAK